MSHWKSLGFALFAAVCLLGEGTGSAQAQCISGCATEWSGGNFFILGSGNAYGINDTGQAVGFSYGVDNGYATEWSGGRVIQLGPGTAYGINDAGQVVGESPFSVGGVGYQFATEWSGGSVIHLGVLPGFFGSTAYGINDSGQVAGGTYVLPSGYDVAT